MLSTRSNAATHLKGDGKYLTWFLAVPGHGVLTIRTSSILDDPRGKLQVEGASVLTSSEIGYSPDLVS